ncbi:MAG: CDP-alcohol phosphatidyltransferase family protein [Myxococcales bacterium]|nr:CDP-alcohol phosphatidyltransferase family protein [Myxococcales bacterium]
MLWADLLSLVRIPLGVVFLFVADWPIGALGVIALAGLTDMLDGYVARRVMGPRAGGRHRGDWLDPLCDKIFVAFMLAGLVFVRGTPWLFVLVLLLRDLLQVVSLGVLALIPALHRRPYDYRANRLGKLTTVFQFLAALVILAGQPPPWPLAIVTASLGVTSLVTYIARVRAPAAAPLP